MAKVIINKTTAAVTVDSNLSEPFQVSPDRPRKLLAGVLSGAETVTLYSYNDAIQDFQIAQRSAGDIVLTASLAETLIVAPGRYRCAKSATASLCGVTID